MLALCLSLLTLQAASVAPASRPAPHHPASRAADSKPSIVLVHGAFADGSSWQRVIPLLQRAGYSVTAVQNPLTSLAADVETTRRAIDAEPGNVVLVGHSYGGAVITEAAAGSTKVKALVYISAFGPEAGEAIGAFGKRYPAALDKGLRPDASGFLFVDRAQFHALFAADVPEAETNILAATQKPIIASVFESTVSKAAWKDIPSWYLVTQDDQAINPDLQRFYAKRMGARATEVKASHVSFLSHPAEVARIIEQAAAGAPRP